VKARNCAWIDTQQTVSKRAVWTRKAVFSVRCPKSVITAQSLHFLEQFRWWKQCGGGAIWEMDAKSADALMVLEDAWEMEKRSEQS
jgi:hypothetical protein